MTISSLENSVAYERAEATFFPMPFHYIEISLLLLTYAKEDIPMVEITKFGKY
jgi:hypothetical protein